MRTNKNGEMIKFLVTDLGIEIVAQSDGRFYSEELPIFETFEEAAMLAIESLSDRVARLEGIPR